jgi:hypothetical protein
VKREGYLVLILGRFPLVGVGVFRERIAERKGKGKRKKGWDDFKIVLSFELGLRLPRCAQGARKNWLAVLAIFRAGG